jgi:hypothetical protein
LTPNAQHSEGSQAPAPWGSHGLDFPWYATFLTALLQRNISIAPEAVVSIGLREAHK